MIHRFKGTVAIGGTGIIAQVDIVILRQAGDHFFENGKAAITRVKNADRLLHIEFRQKIYPNLKNFAFATGPNNANRAFAQMQKRQRAFSGASAIVSTMYNEPYLTPSFFFTRGRMSSAGGETRNAPFYST